MNKCTIYFPNTQPLPRFFAFYRRGSSLRTERSLADPPDGFSGHPSCRAVFEPHSIGIQTAIGRRISEKKRGLSVALSVFGGYLYFASGRMKVSVTSCTSSSRPSEAVAAKTATLRSSGKVTLVAPSGIVSATRYMYEKS